MANPNWKLFLLRAILIAAAGLWVFSPALNGDWLWDDDTDIVHNPLLQSAAGLQTIWLEPGRLSAYYPITFSVEWMEWHLWGATSPGYHLVTLLFHILNGFLLWRLLSKMRLKLAWLGGLLFVIHPANVETAAWIVELKNTLALTPFLLAMSAWIDYEENRRSRDYWLCWGLFLVAMLCKTTAMMFPFVILLYGWWREGRVSWRTLKSSLLFFPISLALCFATTLLQQHHSTLTSDIPIGGLWSRLACAGLSFSFYFSKVFLPVSMMPIYPQWPLNPPTLLEFLPWPVFLAFFYWVWTQRASWGRHVLLGIGFFFINLIPVLGFKVFSYMGFTWVMDHFLYIPMIGLIGLIIAGVEKIDDHTSSVQHAALTGLIAVTMAVLMLGSHAYAQIFVNQEALWTYTLKHNEAAWPAHDNLGNVLFTQGHIDEAIAHYQRSLQINPNRFEAHNNLGVALSLKGRAAEAIDQYEQSLAIKSDYATARINLGDALSSLGKESEAINQYELALGIDPVNGAVREKLNKLRGLQKSNP